MQRKARASRILKCFTEEFMLASYRGGPESPRLIHNIRVPTQIENPRFNGPGGQFISKKRQEIPPPFPFFRGIWSHFEYLPRRFNRLHIYACIKRALGSRLQGHPLPVE